MIIDLCFILTQAFTATLPGTGSTNLLLLIINKISCVKNSYNKLYSDIVT